MTYFWASKRQFIKGIKCNGCHDTFDYFSMNEVGGSYYCGGCNSMLGENKGQPIIGVNQSQQEPTQSTGIKVKPTQETYTFTSTHESEEDKKEEKKEKEKPNLKPVEEGIASVEGQEPFIPSFLFEESIYTMTSENKDQEAQKYYNNISFKAWIRIEKGIKTLPFHLFRDDLNTMRHYYKQWKNWKAGKDENEGQEENNDISNPNKQ